MSDLICRKTMQRCQTPGMCLPFQGCPDPMQRTMHGQLAAKDAEIAELRRTAADWAKAYAYVTDILPLDPRHFARDPACPLNLAEQDRHRVDVLIGERDAARQDLYFNKAYLAQRDVALAQQRADWAKAVTERDAARAEIAELRARLVECEEAVDQAVALAEYLEGHSKGAMAERVKTALSAKFAQERAHYIHNLRNEHYDLQGEHTETLALLGAWQQRAQQAESERDEARECVRRLYACLDDAVTDAAQKAWREWVEALAATPEHLRSTEPTP